MSDPGTLWKLGDINLKKRVQDAIFPEGLVYDFDHGFGTVKVAESYLLAKEIADESAKTPNLVGAVGIEPTTKWL